MLTRAIEPGGSAAAAEARPLPATDSALMHALLQQLPRCLYMNPDTAGSPREAGAAPQPAPPCMVPLRTTVLAAMDTLLRLHPPPFSAPVCGHLPAIAAAVKFADPETRMSACALVATLLQPEWLAALQAAPEWPSARQQLFVAHLRGSSADCGAALAEGSAWDTHLVSALKLAALSALIKLQALPALRARVPLHLLELISTSNSLQRAVADSNALEHLTTFLLAEVRRPACMPPRPHPRHHAWSTCMSSVCALQTEAAAWRRRSSAGAGAATGQAGGGADAQGDANADAQAGAGTDAAPASPRPPSTHASLQLHSALQCIQLLCSCGIQASAPSVSAGSWSDASRCGTGLSSCQPSHVQCVRNCAAMATAATLRALAHCLRHPSSAVREAAALVRPPLCMRPLCARHSVRGCPPCRCSGSLAAAARRSRRSASATPRSP
jgi:hypothetical protein